MNKTIRIVSDGFKGKLSAKLRGQLEVRKDEIIRRIEEGTLHYTHVMAAFQAIIEAKSLIKVSTDKGTDLEFWDKFYGKYFNLPFSFTDLIIPPKPKEGNWRLLIILKGLTNDKAYEACEKRFPCFTEVINLNEVVPENERDPKNGSYAIWVRDTVEADEVYKSKSADMIKKAGIKTETLLERMIHELVYFSETLKKGQRAGKHLDVDNTTLCSGSRDSNGYVPDATWSDGEFKVQFSPETDLHGELRSREVVAVEPMVGFCNED